MRRSDRIRLTFRGVEGRFRQISLPGDHPSVCDALMIGSSNIEGSEGLGETMVEVYRPEPCKKQLEDSVEVEEQVFLTVSEASFDHFVGTSLKVVDLYFTFEDSYTDGDDDVEMSDVQFQAAEKCPQDTCESTKCARSSMSMDVDGIYRLFRIQFYFHVVTYNEGSSQTLIKTSRGRIAWMTLKKSLRMFVSCVKPDVDRHENKRKLQSSEASLESIQESETETTELTSSGDLSAMIYSSVDDTDVGFDDPPGLVSMTTTTVSSPTVVASPVPPPTTSPITSVSKDVPHFCPLEFYRQRVKRFVVTYGIPSGPLLPDVHINDLGKKCLVLDLDETLIHSQFNQVAKPDLEVPIQFEDGHVKPIFVCKRPGVDAFLEFCGRHFEVVIFTASLASYADPVIDFLDKTKTIKHRLYRDSCVFAEGLYLKDLSRLGRPLEQTILVDNAATSYLLQPENGVAIHSWFSDPDDIELLGRLQPALAALPKASTVFEWKSEWSHCITE